MNYDLSKIRIKCAEIVGFKMLAPSDWVWRSGPYDILPTAIREGYTKVIPNYPESADAALELVEWMAKPENGEFEYRASNDNWTPNRHHFQFVNDEKSFDVFADTFPLAVCLAFLKANNINPETL